MIYKVMTGAVLALSVAVLPAERVEADAGDFIAGAIIGVERTRPAERAGSGLRQHAVIVKGENLGIAGLAYGLFALAAQVIEAGPVGMGLEKGEDLFGRAVPGAEPIPFDQCGCCLLYTSDAADE